jgi:hypothetical protein
LGEVINSPSIAANAAVKQWPDINIIFQWISKSIYKIWEIWYCFCCYHSFLMTVFVENGILCNITDDREYRRGIN